MKYYLHISLLCCLLALNTKAQELDSLRDILSATTQVEKRIELLKIIGDSLIANRNPNAIIYFEELIEIGINQKNALLVANAYNKIGISWYYQGDLDKSSQALYMALEITENKAEFNEVRSRINNNLGWNFKLVNDSERALLFYLEAEKFARLNPTQDGYLGLILNNKGVVQKDLSRYSEALTTLTESLLINRKYNNTRLIRFNLNNIGVTLVRLGLYQQAIDTLSNVLLLNRAVNDTTEIVNNLYNLGSAYHHINELDKARFYLESALSFNEKISLITASRIHLELNELLAKSGLYEESRFYLIKYMGLVDSLNRLKFREHTLELDTKYNSAIKDRDLENSKRSLAQQQLVLVLIASALIIVLIFSTFLWGNIKIKQRNQTQLIELNNEIEAQAEELRQSNDNIHAINENLEKIIEERTQVIKDQNQRLLQFAFMNSHKIRGPLATLLGLVSLIKLEKDPQKQHEIIGYIAEAAQKMDEIIHKVSRQLEDDGFKHTERESSTTDT